MLVQSPPTGAGPTTDVERVRRAIAQLPPTDRDLLVLRFAEDLGTADLAAVLGTTPASVLRRLHDAGWVVEDLAGVRPAAGGAPWPPLLVDRPAELVEEEAGAGITPLLAARLAAAVAGEPPPADDHWRFHAVVRVFRDRADGVLTALFVAAAAWPAAASLAQL